MALIVRRFCPFLRTIAWLKLPSEATGTDVPLMRSSLIPESSVMVPATLRIPLLVELPSLRVDIDKTGETVSII